MVGGRRTVRGRQGQHSWARAVIAELVRETRLKPWNIPTSMSLEPGHAAGKYPRVRRIKAPQKVHPLFDQIVRSAAILDILKQLIGPGLRLHGSKLNMKSAHYGSPVEWHQDWAFYPHTNDDVLAIGVLLDDCDLANGPMLVTPGTHTREVWNHHGEDGCFAGLIDPDTIQPEIARAVPCMGRAGSMSFHHVRALHGSALNSSDRPRNLLLYEVAASDAWPLMGVKDFGGTGGPPVVRPIQVGGAADDQHVPVRLPLPPATRRGLDLRDPVGGEEKSMPPRGMIRRWRSNSASCSRYGADGAASRRRAGMRHYGPGVRRPVRDAGFDGAGVRFIDRRCAAEAAGFLRERGTSIWQAQCCPANVDDLEAECWTLVARLSADRVNLQPKMCGRIRDRRLHSRCSIAGGGWPNQAGVADAMSKPAATARPRTCLLRPCNCWITFPTCG